MDGPNRLLFKSFFWMVVTPAEKLSPDHLVDMDAFLAKVMKAHVSRESQRHLSGFMRRFLALCELGGYTRALEAAGPLTQIFSAFSEEKIRNELDAEILMCGFAKTNQEIARSFAKKVQHRFAPTNIEEIPGLRWTHFSLRLLEHNLKEEIIQIATPLLPDMRRALADGIRKIPDRFEQISRARAAAIADAIEELR